MAANVQSASAADGLSASPALAAADVVDLAVGSALVPTEASEATESARVADTRRRADYAWVRACVAVDALMLGAAVATSEFGATHAGVPSTPTAWLVLFALLVAAVLWKRGLYAERLTLRAADDVRSIMGAAGIAAIGLLAVRTVAFPDPAAGSQMLRLFAFAALYVVGGRVVLFGSEVAARRRGETLRPTLVVGAGLVGSLVANRLLSHPELGLAPVGFLDVDADDSIVDAPLPVVGTLGELEAVVAEHRVQQVIVTFSKESDESLLRLAENCERLGADVAFVPRFFDRMSDRVQFDHVLGMPLLRVDLPDPRGWQFAVKHAFDRIVAAALVVLLAPVFLAAMIAVYVSLGRPLFFRQTRVGRDGETFEILKFRTMRPPSAAVSDFALSADSAPGGVEGEDRRTRVGDLLRRTSIDELPQLFNVLKGEMSLVGPRPERPQYVEAFGGAVRRYNDRHRVKSGITGWAQVNGLRGKTSISERAELDNYYVQNWSLGLDLKILLLTAFAVVTAFRTVE